MLTNLTEIYALFKSKNSKFIIWSLDFRSSLPEMAQTYRCIRLPQCLCMHYHQNVRLMIHAENPSLDNKNILKLCVCCDITNHSCVLYHCDLCPHKCVGREFLMGQLWNNNYSPSDSIKNQRWVSRDRSQLQDNEKDFHDFLANLLSMLFKLTEHHFIAKSQINFFKEQKETLNQDGCILVLDFAGNYAFDIQGCAQDFHWNNSQATIYSLVLYYVDTEKEAVFQFLPLFFSLLPSVIVKVELSSKKM